MLLVKYGSYTHPVSSTGLTFSTEIRENEQGLPVAIDYTVNLEGKLLNPTANPRDLDHLIATLEAAYSIRGLDFGIVHKDGRPTRAFWRNSDTIGGIRANFYAAPNYQGAEYVTYRTFQLRVTFSMLPFNSPQFLRFTETIQISGGGPTFDVMEVPFGEGIRHRTRTHSKCTATQSGSAVTRFKFPIIPRPIWPHALAKAQPDETTVYRPKGGRPNGQITLEECEISWRYDYVWPTRLFGVPHYSLG
jgi:hypothetical protein